MHHLPQFKNLLSIFENLTFSLELINIIMRIVVMLAAHDEVLKLQNIANEICDVQ